MITDPIHALTSNNPEFLPPMNRLVRHMIDFVKWRFSLLPRGTYHWDPESDETPDQKGSELFIGSDTPVNTTMVGKRPAITVLHSQAQFQGISIGDKLWADMRTGGRAYMDLIPTTLVVHTLARKPIVASRLAWFVQEQIFALRDEIVKTEPCLVYIGARASISPPSPAGTLVDSGATDWSCVTYAYPAFLQYVAERSPLNKKILNKLNPVIRSR